MIPASSTQLGRWEERVSVTDWDSVRADLDTVPKSGGRTYSLLGADRRLYRSTAPGRFGGHRKSRIYGRLDCPAALRAIVGGGYTAHRVFFADEQTAVAAGYRPCAVCLPGAYAAWKAR
jgi:hypothetical protein